MEFIKKWLIVIAFTGVHFIAVAQDTMINKTSSPSVKKDSSGKQINKINPNDYSSNPLLTPRTYLFLLGNNLKKEFTKPFHLKKKDWGNLGGCTAITFALSFADEPIQQSALRLKNRKTSVNDISNGLSDFGAVYEVVTVAGIGAYGLIISNNKLVNTTLLASQAYITSGAAMTFIKLLAGRTRPSYYPAGVEAEPRFLGLFHRKLNDANGTNENSSFPSGHTTVAFAVATVFASEYKDNPWVSVVSYTTASLIGASRITQNKHWITDVVVGAALGYVTGKLVDNNYHSYTKIKASERTKNKISFHLEYNVTHLEPGLVYTFRR
ncbi:MAG: phosphatase PAP2 family protein [Ginsengibacter sp.]